MIRARDNPFATDRVLAVRYQPIGWTWDELMARLSRLRYRCAIVGPEGFGKTTLLEDLEPLLVARGFAVRWLRFNREQRTIPVNFAASISSGDIVLFDGCEQIGALAWRRFLFRTRRAGGVIVTTHTPGRLPTLVECATSPELLGGIIPS